MNDHEFQPQTLLESFKLFLYNKTLFKHFQWGLREICMERNMKKMTFMQIYARLFFPIFFPSFLSFILPLAVETCRNLFIDVRRFNPEKYIAMAPQESDYRNLLANPVPVVDAPPICPA